MRIVSLCVAVAVGCNHSADPSGPSAPSDPTATFVAGSRLSVDGWAHGDLFLPTGFYDTKLDAPCSLTTVEGQAACAPEGHLVLGYTDKSCTELVAVDLNPAGPDKLLPGVFGFDPAHPESPLYRTVERIGKGAVYWSSDACATEPAVAEWPANTVQWRVERVDPSELVQFSERTVHATDALDVAVAEGTDGSQHVTGVSIGGLACLSVDLGACFTTDPMRVMGPGVLGDHWPFTDDACTTPGALPTGSPCDVDAGVVYVRSDECGTPSVVGVTTGAAPSGPLYTVQVDGSCGPADPVTCADGLAPLDPSTLPTFDVTGIDADGLILVITKAGTIPVDQRFALVRRQPCSPHLSAEGATVCAPDTIPQQPTIALDLGVSGIGDYVSACDGASGPTLYHFAAGEPCGVGAPQNDATIVQRAFTFAPWTGEVWLSNPIALTCDPVVNDGGWFAMQEASVAATLPTLEATRR